MTRGVGLFLGLMQTSSPCCISSVFFFVYFRTRITVPQLLLQRPDHWFRFFLMFSAINCFFFWKGLGQWYNLVSQEEQFEVLLVIQSIRVILKWVGEGKKKSFPPHQNIPLLPPCNHQSIFHQTPFLPLTIASLWDLFLDLYPIPLS